MQRIRGPLTWPVRFSIGSGSCSSAQVAKGPRRGPDMSGLTASSRSLNRDGSTNGRGRRAALTAAAASRTRKRFRAEPVSTSSAFTTLLSLVLILCYFSLAIVALVHEVRDATRAERLEWGLNLLVVCLILGLAPMPPRRSRFRIRASYCRGRLLRPHMGAHTIRAGAGDDPAGEDEAACGRPRRGVKGCRPCHDRAAVIDVLQNEARRRERWASSVTGRLACHAANRIGG